MKKGKTKKKNAHKSEPGQGFNRKLIFFFLNCPGGNIIWISWEKFRKIALLNRVNSNNTISQIWNTWRVKIAHFVTNIDIVKIIAIFY